MDDRDQVRTDEEQAAAEARRQEALTDGPYTGGVDATADEQPVDPGLPASAPIPQLPEDALPQEPQQPVEVPDNAMPGTDENGDPIEAPAQDGSPDSSLMTEQPDQPVPSPDSEQ